jgi:hypothetical protein
MHVCALLTFVLRTPPAAANSQKTLLQNSILGNSACLCLLLLLQLLLVQGMTNCYCDNAKEAHMLQVLRLYLACTLYHYDSASAYELCMHAHTTVV